MADVVASNNVVPPQDTMYLNPTESHHDDFVELSTLLGDDEIVYDHTSSLLLEPTGSILTKRLHEPLPEFSYSSYQQVATATDPARVSPTPSSGSSSTTKTFANSQVNGSALPKLPQQKKTSTNVANDQNESRASSKTVSKNASSSAKTSRKRKASSSSDNGAAVQTANNDLPLSSDISDPTARQKMRRR